jgi:hypothetical protein
VVIIKTRLGKDMEKSEPWHTVTFPCGNASGIAAVKSNTAVPQKIKNRDTCDPALPLLMYSQKN